MGTPYWGRGLVGYRKRFNRQHARIRGVGERAVATLKAWRVLAKVRCSPHRISPLLTAILTLHHTRMIKMEKAQLLSLITLQSIRGRALTALSARDRRKDSLAHPHCPRPPG